MVFTIVILCVRIGSDISVTLPFVYSSFVSWEAKHKGRIHGHMIG